jgi:hypothetical protein
MIHCLRGAALSAGLILNCGMAFGQQPSASAIMPGCRVMLSPLQVEAPEGLKFNAAKCSGLVEGIAYGASAARDIPGAGVCPDPRVSVGQTIRVVVNYIDARPARLNEPFKALALEALRAAWPCKK